MTDSTDGLTAALREVAEAATPGPWEWEDEGFMGCGQVWTQGEGVEGGSIAGPTGDCYPRSGYSPKEDMQFIATFDPPTVLGLLDTIDALAARLARFSDGLREQIRDTLAGHRIHKSDSAKDYGHWVTCECGWQSKPCKSESLVPVAEQHQAHVADAVLAAIEEGNR